MSRQAQKEAAAAAAQDMLKLDAARMRKPAASQSRKGAAAPMRKAQGGARAESMASGASGGEHPGGNGVHPSGDGEGSGGEFFASGGDGGDEDTVLEEIDPAEVYTLEDFLAEDEIMESFRRKIGDKLKAKIEGSSSAPPRRRQRQSGPRRYIPRPREKGHEDLARKEAAAAAQDMLKLDAARMRKPAALQSRKGAAAPMRKAREELGRRVGSGAGVHPGGDGEGSGGEFFASGGDGGDEDTVLEEIDPAEVYTLEDFLAEDEIMESFRRKIGDKLRAKIEGSSSGPPRRLQRQSGPRRYIPRPREKGHEDLVANYFSANPIYTDEQFRRRNSAIWAASTHRQLKNDLVEHIWQRHGPRGG
uniref:Uncharacterized protein n=1 Tax=Oryza barthii TaxID=65489 RepID=A0A0D3HM52_9ORYZ